VFPDGVWLVELAPLADPTLVPQTVATVLGVKEEAGRPILTTLTDHLRGKTALLVLDNCEHLVAASAQFAEAVLQACPHLCILASSREMLGVAGERAFYVPSLSTPDPRASISVETLKSYEAVRLFVERAAVVAPHFDLNSDNAPAVTQVCQRLDGIPLALELAAARLRMLPMEQIAARLDDSFRLLTGGSRTALPRHQTLQALIDWSYELLTEAEQVVFRRLAVFAGSWALEAAEAVCVGEGIKTDEVFDLLAHLLDKSLVLAEEQSKTARYRMLETVRQYALGKLAASGEADAVRQRHANFFLALAEASASFSPFSAWLDRMETEHENLRAALTWSLSAQGSAELGLRLAAEAWWFCRFRGYWNEARGWLEGALAHAEGVDYPRVRARVLWGLGDMLAFQSDYAAGQAQFAHSLRLFQELGDLPSSAWIINRIGWLARERGDATTARLRLEESLALYRELGDEDGIAWVLVTLGEVAVMQEDAAWATALLEEGLALSQRNIYRKGWALNHLGHVAQIQGEYERATRLHMESLPLFRDSGAQDVGVAWAHQGLGETALAQGDATLATPHFTEALALFRDLGDWAGMSWCLAGLAGAAAVDEEPERAAWLWGAAEALRQSIGAREAPASRSTRERLQAAVRAQLGEAAFNAAWAEGQATTMEQAIAWALQ
jgi:non-specific serine/threonine protein kinase